MGASIANAAGALGVQGSGVNSAQNRARTQSIIPRVTGGMGLGEAVSNSSGLAGMASTTAVQNRDSNNIRQSSGSGSIVSEADMNRVQDRNSGSGQLTQMMHETNSDMPMVKPMASKPRMQPGMGYSSVMSPFSPPELSTGDSLYGSELQKQEIMNPMPEANIDATGMNSLYGGPLSMDGGPKAFMGINPDHKGYCTPMTKPTCTPRRKALAKRLKPGGDLYKSKK